MQFNDIEVCGSIVPIEVRSAGFVLGKIVNNSSV